MGRGEDDRRREPRAVAIRSNDLPIPWDDLGFAGGADRRSSFSELPPALLRAAGRIRRRDVIEDRPGPRLPRDLLDAKPEGMAARARGLAEHRRTRFHPYRSNWLRASISGPPAHEDHRRGLGGPLSLAAPAAP